MSIVIALGGTSISDIAVLAHLEPVLGPRHRTRLRGARWNWADPRTLGKIAKARQGPGARMQSVGHCGPACVAIPVSPGSAVAQGGCEETESAGTLDGLPAAVHAELGIDVVDVRLDGVHRNVKLVSDLLL